MSLDFLSVIRQESALLAQAAQTASLDRPVPSCPGWTLGKLVGHVGTVQNWAATMVESRAQERLDPKALPKPPEGDAVVPWFQAASQRLLAVLAATDPSTPVWHWTPNHTAAAWQRREAHEVAIHRWDAQDARGGAAALDAALAVDGVDELLELHQFRQPERFVGPPATLHLHATDAPGEWLLRLGESGLVVERRHAKGDVAARGRASDLDLFLWGRVDARALEVFGDAALLTRLQGLTAL